MKVDGVSLANANEDRLDLQWILRLNKVLSRWQYWHMLFNPDFTLILQRILHSNI